MDDYLSTIEHRVNARSFKIKNASTYPGIQWDRKIENRKSAVIAKVEHMFLIVKRYFGYRKTAYMGVIHRKQWITHRMGLKTGKLH